MRPRSQAAFLFLFCPSLRQLYAAREQGISFEVATINALKTAVAELPALFKDARINDIVNEALTLM
jgi:hypothetical protein